VLVAILFVFGSTTHADALHYSVDSSFFLQGPPPMASDGKTPLIQFNPVSDATLPDPASTSSQVISLGSVTVTQPSGGAAPAVSGLPFHLEVRIPGLTVSTPVSSGWWDTTRAGIMIDGTISGRLDATNGSNLLMSARSIQLGSWGPFIPEETRTFTFPIDLKRLGFDPIAIDLAPTSTSGTYSVLMSIQPVPEPTTVLSWAFAAICAAGMGRRVAGAAWKG
jgi:hypothetical protein